MPSGVFVDNGTVARVLERRGHGRLPLHGDCFPHGAHRLPRPAILVLVRVRRIGAIDVEVLAVGGEDGESPRAVLVVADGDAGNHRLAATDDVPAWRLE